MSTSPRKILEHAEQICSGRPDEIGWRCAASRAYYAALHAVKATFERPSKLPTGRTESTHEEVIRAAGEYARAKKPACDQAAVIAQQLARMKSDRTLADYYLDKRFGDDDCQRMMKRATALQDLCAIVADATVPAPDDAKQAEEEAPAPDASARVFFPQSSPLPDENPPPSSPRPNLRRVQ
jgi:uncharacterized protein (UPF0332 family)